MKKITLILIISIFTNYITFSNQLEKKSIEKKIIYNFIDQSQKLKTNNYSNLNEKNFKRYLKAGLSVIIPASILNIAVTIPYIICVVYGGNFMFGMTRDMFMGKVYAIQFFKFLECLVGVSNILGIFLIVTSIVAIIIGIVLLSKSAKYYHEWEKNKLENNKGGVEIYSFSIKL